MFKAVKENLQVIFYACIIAIVFRSLLFQPFFIPSKSMVPTLLVGDRLFVSKFSYGYSRHSFPLSPPILSNRIFFSEPDLGDVIVFKTTVDNRTDYIKRLVGLPGDRIRIANGVLFINDKEIKRKRVDDYFVMNSIGESFGIRRYEETLPNGVQYFVLDLVDDGPMDNTKTFQVPNDHYFFMGDNRDNSLDSRTKSLGYVPRENLVGKAEIIFFSSSSKSRFFEIWSWYDLFIKQIRSERFLESIV